MNFTYYKKYTDGKYVTHLKASAYTKYSRQILMKRELSEVYNSVKIFIRSCSHHL
jgi:hypothetical protein